FLISERQVMLILGDSGSGKSTFNRHLEHQLWTEYKQGGPIPLFINLPAIDRPDRDLIGKQLKLNNFKDDQIQEMKQHRQLVLICDGYDETRLSINLYTSNHLNQPGQWNVKMIISCRNTYLSRDYKDRFRPLGANHYNNSSQGHFEEATIVPFSRSDIQTYVEHHVHGLVVQGFLVDQSDTSINEYMKKLSTIPNMMDLVKNPFLLTLALRTLPFVSIDDLDLSVITATRLQLYDKFIKHWIRSSKKRLHRTTHSQATDAVFQQLLEANFRRCVIDYLKELAGAIFRHQAGQSIVDYIDLNDDKTWKANFFGPSPQPTLLREASPLSRAGISHWFIHQSLLEYFRALGYHDSTSYDDDDSDDDGDEFRGGGGNSRGGGGNSTAGNSDSCDGSNDSSGGSSDSSGDNNDSADDKNNSTSNSSDPPGDSDDSPIGGGDSPNNSNNPPSGGGDSPGSDGSPPGKTPSSQGNDDGSRGSKDSPDENEDDPRRDKDESRSSDVSVPSRAPSSFSDDPFSRNNLTKEPAVLQFLVERAQSDNRLKERLLTAIQDAQSDAKPSLAAANAITILVKAGERFNDIGMDLKGVRIPSDYLSEGSFESNTSWKKAHTLPRLLRPPVQGMGMTTMRSLSLLSAAASATEMAISFGLLAQRPKPAMLEHPVAKAVPKLSM
ncbi:WD_REPEATS_REGION domain-containing protein, partial [Mortierella sp. AD031]